MRVALVNNMPDSAFLATEQQFRAAIGVGGVELELYAISEIPRGAAVDSLIAGRYADAEELVNGHDAPDALILTGTEPTPGALREEPSWVPLARLLEWASASVAHAMLSCLAAHASILLFDGIEREPRTQRLSGVLPNDPLEPGHPLARGLPAGAPVPHSRVNDIPESIVLERGYEVILRSEPAGWSIASRQQGRCSFVLCQGHPEYGPLSLLREYRRDVRRSLLAWDTTPYPPLPTNYLEPGGQRLAEEFRRHAEDGMRAGGEPLELYGQFPFAALAAAVRHSWAPTSAAFYRNWLSLVGASAR